MFVNLFYFTRKKQVSVRNSKKKFKLSLFRRSFKSPKLIKFSKKKNLDELKHILQFDKNRFEEKEKQELQLT